MDFEAGRLVWRLMTVGKQVLQQDQADAQAAFEKTGQAATEASKKIDGSGEATDRAGKKARDVKAPLEEQAKAQRKAGDEADTSAKKQRDQAAATDQQVAAAKQLSAALVVAGVAVSAVIGLNVAKYAEFDQAMSNTRAATMATAEEQKILGEAALEAGADTAYSASEAAAAEEELAKAGQSVTAIVGGSLNGALALAAAGQLQVARSAEIMATSLTQFRLPAEQAGHVADVLAAGAGKAQGSVDDLALALSYVGPLAGSVGLSLDETAGTIAYFATQGIIGEKAGTSLRGVLSSLQAPSMAASKELDKYGISVFDANGNMLSLSGIAEQLKSRLGGLTEQERLAALGRIFGNESLNAATLLYEGGAAKIQEWTENVNDSGYAAEQAAIRQDNLAGDVEKLGGALDTALIRTGSGANDVLREMVQIATQLVDVYGEMPAPVQATALVIGAAAAAALLFAGGAVQVRARLIELQAEFAKTNASMRTTALVGAGVGIALTGIVTVIGLVIARQAEMNAGSAEFADTLDDVTGAVTENTRAMIAKRLADSNVFDQAKKVGLSQKELTDALYEGGAAADDVIRRFKDASFAAGGFDIGLQDAGRAVDDMNTQLERSKTRHDDLQAATQGSTSATGKGVEVTKTAAEAYLSAADQAGSFEDQLRKLIDRINEANGVGQDAVSSNIAYQDALAKVDETIQKARDGQEGYALTLDQQTQVGRDNLGMLNELAQQSQKAADDQFRLDGNTQAYRETLEQGRQALIDRAEALGYNAEQAGALADQIYRIPTEREVEIIAETQNAIAKAAEFKAMWEGIRSRTVTLDAVPLIGGGQVQRSGPLASGYQLAQADGGVVNYYARGAVLSGAGSEHHVAQMAKAGSYRVWAEPETGGETYVPHAESKRARSEAIMAETAAIFGGMYIPAAALAGGAAVPQTAGSGPVVNIAAINIPPGVTYAEAVSIASEAVQDGISKAMPGGSY
ncbi:phage tail tape measure protein, TP901 family, core region [Microbacterium hydrothermale]|uniref:phage tail tape measure protein n=1 Tax=Microbacterium hydrothermale TaxID=857427 RepID=UPI0022260980|nr:phage tail tape measure protein [Microbacterium hydrothermale]MCW2165406.1 phage tail tape measure protein, TP901 family, core region [Microbacterium hydrothermale]